MNSYIFDSITFEKFYNCANANLSVTSKESSPSSPILGIVFLFTFTLCETLYFPLLFVLQLPFYRSKSCYKLMHAIICIDLLTMPINGALTGFFYLQGSSYCDFPMLNLFAGAFGNAFWMGQSLLTVILALDRCLSMIAPAWGLLLFGGNRAYLWIGADLIYMTVIFLTTKSVFFNAELGAWFFDPFLGHDFSYRNYVHSIHNFSIPFFLALFYTIFGLSLLKKKLMASQHSQVSNAMYSEASVFFQVFIISSANFFCALSYDFAQFFPLPTIFIKVSSYCWLFVHGFPSVLYLTTNKRIRKDFFGVFRIKNACKNLKTPKIIIFTSNATTVIAQNKDATWTGK